MDTPFLISERLWVAPLSPYCDKLYQRPITRKVGQIMYFLDIKFHQYGLMISLGKLHENVITFYGGKI